MRVPTGRLWVVEDPEPQTPLEGVDAGPPSPGRYIRDQRLRRGMTLEEVAAKTKIPRASLEALEEERWSALPGPVFVKGFLRCCARALEIDDQVVLDLLYEQERAKMRAEHEPEPEPEP
ncbi:MAG: helix-turn-helix domain-containing protein, partial [Myxococcales bacterium]|nr:helix-turn-helix domain-containing protein [Myxococcales bacterium]